VVVLDKFGGKPEGLELVSSEDFHEESPLVFKGLVA
jgi:hypothetical protein